MNPKADALQQGKIEFSKRNIELALRYFTSAEREGGDPDCCAAYRWDCHMLLGDFESAWQESDGIISRGGPDPGRLWDQTPWDGKSVMIRCLHGLGDAIQFTRYAKLLRQKARRVVIQTHPELVSLLERLNSADRVITWNDSALEGETGWDQQFEIMELPRAFRTTLASIPTDIPYLAITEGEKRRHLKMLAPSRSRKVGLLWGSSEWNPARSIPLRDLVSLLELSRRELGNICFYSFQRGPRRSELLSSPPVWHLSDTAKHSTEILETAADLLNMDLLITVDTMAAHLAGSLGVTCCVLLPFEADWRWMLARQDSPWYPTMRLFRQQRPGEWEDPVRQAGALLKALVHSQSKPA